MASNALVIGAGCIGTAITDRLAAEDWAVTVATWGHAASPGSAGERVEHLQVDRTITGAVAAAVGSGRDAVIGTIVFGDADADSCSPAERMSAPSW